MRKIDNVTIGTITENRAFDNLDLVPLDPVSDEAIRIKDMITNLVLANVKEIPTAEQAGQLQLWMLAFVQQIDIVLAKLGKQARLDFILEILEDTGLFDINKDLSHA